MSESELKSLEFELEELKRQYRSLTAQLQRDIQQRLAEERNKLLAKINTELEALAAEKNVKPRQDCNFASPNKADLTDELLMRLNQPQPQ